MAERGFTPINVLGLFGDKQLIAGSSGTSGIIDLRYAAQRNVYALSFSMANGSAGTCGTTIFTYVQSPTFEGTYVTPVAAVAIGTAGIGGTSGLSNIVSFSPVLAPFMKIIATQTGSGGTGNDSRITAHLIVQ
jgi:hypothetical protein